MGTWQRPHPKVKQGGTAKSRKPRIKVILRKRSQIVSEGSPVHGGVLRKTIGRGGGSGEVKIRVKNATPTGRPVGCYSVQEKGGLWEKKKAEWHGRIADCAGKGATVCSSRVTKALLGTA